jgi:signal transduction histidine kinase
MICGRAIELVAASAGTPVMVDADRAMMTEAARSLLLNAIEAIGCDGRVVLGCEIEPDSGAAVMTVCDSGPGLSPVAVLHAFDPYFSGREAGRGLGVGLCRVDTIAKIHGGDVRLSSGTVGCTARVWIPVSP